MSSITVIDNLKKVFPLTHFVLSVLRKRFPFINNHFIVFWILNTVLTEFASCFQVNGNTSYMFLCSTEEKKAKFRGTWFIVPDIINFIKTYKIFFCFYFLLKRYKWELSLSKYNLLNRKSWMYLLKNLSFCHWFLLSFVLSCFLLQWYKPYLKANWSWELNYLLVGNSLIIVHHCGKSIRSLGRNLKAGTEAGTTEKSYLLVCFCDSASFSDIPALRWGTSQSRLILTHINN